MLIITKIPNRLKMFAITVMMMFFVFCTVFLVFLLQDAVFGLSDYDLSTSGAAALFVMPVIFWAGVLLLTICGIKKKYFKPVLVSFLILLAALTPWFLNDFYDYSYLTHQGIYTRDGFSSGEKFIPWEKLKEVKLSHYAQTRKDGFKYETIVNLTYTLVLKDGREYDFWDPYMLNEIEKLDRVLHKHKVPFKIAKFTNEDYEFLKKYYAEDDFTASDMDRIKKIYNISSIEQEKN